MDRPPPAGDADAFWLDYLTNGDRLERRVRRVFREHARKAVECATDLLRATGHAEPEGPWVPVGAGVHTGLAWVGAVGDASHTEVTALGDTVNATARLASVAAAGEVLVSSESAAAAGLDPGLERVSLELKGKQQPTEVVRIRVAPGTVAASG